MTQTAQFLSVLIVLVKSIDSMEIVEKDALVWLHIFSHCFIPSVQPVYVWRHISSPWDTRGVWFTWGCLLLFLGPWWEYCMTQSLSCRGVRWDSWHLLSFYVCQLSLIFLTPYCLMSVTSTPKSSAVGLCGVESMMALAYSDMAVWRYILRLDPFLVLHCFLVDK